MAVYRIGDILRMKREALGITREKLCELSEEICSPQTLYRMECGKVKVKQEVYRKLMECMGELPERNYASVLVSNYKALNLKTEIDVHLSFDEYEQVEKKIEELEPFLESKYVRNKQYVVIDGLICPKPTGLYCPDSAELNVRQSGVKISVWRTCFLKLFHILQCTCNCDCVYFS